MTVTQNERRAMCDLLDELGPDRPTLCGEWSTRDLLAHLLVRERRPDASLGILVPAMAKRTERVMAEIASQSFPKMVDTSATAHRCGPCRGRSRSSATE